MATAPLFVVDLATLKQKLRLSGVVDNAGLDADAIIDESILAVRVNFYRRLGSARMAELLALPFASNPTSDNEMLRALANTTEVNWVREELMCRLPWLWQDSSGQAQKAWNEEAPFREKGPLTYEQLHECLMRAIEEALDILAGTELFGGQSEVRAFDGKPASQAPGIGFTLSRSFNYE